MECQLVTMQQLGDSYFQELLDIPLMQIVSQKRFSFAFLIIPWHGPNSVILAPNCAGKKQTMNEQTINNLVRGLDRLKWKKRRQKCLVKALSIWGKAITRDKFRLSFGRYALQQTGGQNGGTYTREVRSVPCGCPARY